MMSKRNQYLGALALASATSIWGGMYVVSKVMLTVVAPVCLIWLRYLVALVVLTGMALATRQTWSIRRRDIPLVAAVGAIGYALSIWTQFLGTKLSSAQMGSVITSATPAFMVIFARWLLHERVTWRKALSVALASAGVLMIIGVGGMGGSRSGLGGLILAAAAVTWALMSVLVKRVPSDYSQLIVTLYAILTAAVILTPAAITQLFEVPAGVFSSPAFWGGILYVGVVSTAIAFFLWNKGLQMVDATTGGLYFFFQPLVGSLLGWLLLGERVTQWFWFGALAIMVGVVLVVTERQ